jgi:GDP-L-fucose synthase
MNRDRHPIPLDAAIHVPGHRGLVGSAIVRRLEDAGYDNLILRTRAEVDLADQDAVDELYAETRPRYVFMAAAKVGGIHANATEPVDFLADNLRIELNVIEAAFRHGVGRMLFLGSSCIYPKFARQPLTEDALLTGPLEPTNEPYAVAKIAGIKLCDAYAAQYGVDFFSAMPTNLYGPGDNFDLQSSHVLPALLRKFEDAARSGEDEVVVWGTGTPRREFLYVDDLADACIHLMQNHPGGPGLYNIGSGADVTIAELAATIATIVGFEGRVLFDSSKPDGTPRKLMDVSRMSQLGWRASTQLYEGIESTLQWYRNEAAVVQ